MVVFIEKSPNADSRTADNRRISFEEFSKSTDMHREDVKNMMEELARMLVEIGENHDWTKKVKEKEFYNAFMNAKEKGLDFKKDSWYKYHVENERHHLLSRVPEDINLLDVLEYISDCCCAGMARSGKIYDLELSDKVLRDAFENTVKLVKSNIKVIDK